MRRRPEGVSHPMLILASLNDGTRMLNGDAAETAGSLRRGLENRADDG